MSFQVRVPYEIEILWRLRGVAGVVQILEHFEEPDRFVFTMEKFPQSLTLFDLIMENSSLENTELLRHLFREMVRLNSTLQMYGVWHRDCKPENLIFSKADRSLSFIDFGSAAPVQTGDFTEFQVSLSEQTSRDERRLFPGNIGDHGTRMDLTETLRWRESVRVDTRRLSVLYALSRISISLQDWYCQWSVSVGLSEFHGYERVQCYETMSAWKWISTSKIIWTSEFNMVSLDETSVNKRPSL